MHWIIRRADNFATGLAYGAGIALALWLLNADVSVVVSEPSAELEVE